MINYFWLKTILHLFYCDKNKRKFKKVAYVCELCVSSEALMTKTTDLKRK